MRNSAFVAVVLLGTIGAQGEIIGPYDIKAAPIAATQIGPANWGWVNVVNAPVSIHEAFTGFSIIDRGYANGNVNTTVELTFAAGDVVNLPGADLVLVDGFSDNSYAFSTAHDGFLTELLLPDSEFSSTGLLRHYYYQNNLGGSPFPSNIKTVEIDLTSLDVPAGESVSTFRIRATSSQVDLFGLGSLTPEPGSLALFALGGFGLLRRRTRTLSAC